MPAIPLRLDWDAVRVRDAARLTDNAGQARRLLAIAAVYDGMSRAAAATLGGMDRQTLRDWAHRFNAAGPSGLVDRKAPGAAPRLTGDQEAELAAFVEAGPNPETDGVVRWRCLDLKALIRHRFGIDYHERTIGKLLSRLGFAHISQRPRHAGQNPEDIVAFKKTYGREDRGGPDGGDSRRAPWGIGRGGRRPRRAPNCCLPLSDYAPTR